MKLGIKILVLTTLILSIGIISSEVMYNAPPTTPTSLTCNGEPCANGGYNINLELACNGSTDVERNDITYVVEAYHDDKNDVNPLVNNLVAYYSFDEESGGVAKDLIGENSNGNLLGGASFGTGKLGNAVITDGSNDMVEFNYNPEDWDWGTGDFTIQMWIKAPMQSGTKEFFEREPATTQYAGIISDDGISTFRWSTPGAGHTILCGNIWDNQWHHLLVTRNSGNIKLFVDGIICGSVNDGTDISGQGSYYPNPTMMGFRNIGRFTMGALDEVGIWKRGLSDGEVQSIYDGISVFSTSYWYPVGNHSEGGSFNWDLREVDSQSQVKVRCRAIDVTGSNTYSEYYEPNTSLIIYENHAPVLEAIGNKVINETETLTIQLSATDRDGDNLVYTLSENIPSLYSFDSQIGLFQWTPTLNDAGVYQLTFGATDTEYSDEETILVTVNNLFIPNICGNLVCESGIGENPDTCNLDCPRPPPKCTKIQILSGTCRSNPPPSAL